MKIPQKYNKIILTKKTKINQQINEIKAKKSADLLTYIYIYIYIYILSYQGSVTSQFLIFSKLMNCHELSMSCVLV